MLKQKNNNIIAVNPLYSDDYVYDVISDNNTISQEDILDLTKADITKTPADKNFGKPKNEGPNFSLNSRGKIVKFYKQENRAETYSYTK